MRIRQTRSKTPAAGRRLPSCSRFTNTCHANEEPFPGAPILLERENMKGGKTDMAPLLAN